MDTLYCPWYVFTIHEKTKVESEGAQCREGRSDSGGCPVRGLLALVRDERQGRDRTAAYARGTRRIPLFSPGRRREPESGPRLRRRRIKYFDNNRSVRHATMGRGA